MSLAYAPELLLTDLAMPPRLVVQNDEIVGKVLAILEENDGYISNNEIGLQFDPPISIVSCRIIMLGLGYRHK